MNVISVTGRLTKDAATRQAGEGTVTSFTVAENKKAKGVEVSMFYGCSMWGERGEKIAQYLSKGGTVTVIGELLPLREHEGKSYLEIRVQDVSLPPKAAAQEPNGAESW